MKKVLCCVLVIFSLLSIVACGQTGVEKETVVGSWEAQAEMSVLGADISEASESKSAEMLYCFDFNEDGTGKSSIIVDEKYKELVPDTNSEFTYTYDGEKLELKHNDGLIQSFTASFSEGKLILDGRVYLELVRKQ